MNTNRLSIFGLTAVLAAAQVTAPMIARADDHNGKRNLAIGLGIAAGFLLATQHDKTAGVLVGLGAAYEYSQSTDDSRYRYGNHQYYGGSGQYDGYSSGGNYNGGSYNNGSYNNGGYDNGSYNSGSNYNGGGNYNGGYDNSGYNSGGNYNGGYSNGSRYDSRASRSRRPVQSYNSGARRGGQRDARPQRRNVRQ